MSDETSGFDDRSPQERASSPAVTPDKCQLFGNGHSIYDLHEALSGATDNVPADLVLADGSYVDFMTEHGIHRGWNHNPGQLTGLYQTVKHDSEAMAVWSENYSVLTVWHVDHEEGGMVGAAAHLHPEPSPCEATSDKI